MHTHAHTHIFIAMYSPGSAAYSDFEDTGYL